ncbi:hypothetical protein Scep_012212 [Stephania cephalantha]|uniref:Serine/threonine-protein phosphatase 6 regulatory subunit 3 n=1 Tax=Stephania cephalantha TaxID=152367 RepID=A0AAP0P798_9MAGN
MTWEGKEGRCDDENDGALEKVVVCVWGKVDTILDKDKFTLEDLLDEDEIIQECKALNGRLINFLRERAQVEQLLRFIVEEAPEDSEKKRTFKFPFIACEIFTCEVDVILKTLVEDEELMNLLFSFLEPSRSHSTLLAGYFSKDCPEAHANAAETLCAIARYAPPSLATKISSPRFIEVLFCDLLKLMDISTSENVLATTYGSLQPPLGKHRLKIIEFISTLLSIGSEAAEKELIRLGAIQRVLDLFFEYPFSNFLHHHVENIVASCLESNKDMLTEHLLQECDLIKKMLKADKHFTLGSDLKGPTVPNEGKLPPRIGNIGHITRIANKLIHLGNINSKIQAYLQESTEWIDWHANILAKRNTVENVYQWACGRPTTLHDRTRDDDDDYRDRDYDVASLANNLSQAFRYGVYGNDDSDEDVYFDDESAEVVISSLRLGDEPDSASLFTNSNWFAFEDDQIANERSSGSPASPSPNAEAGIASSSSNDEVVVGEDDDLIDTATSSQEPGTSTNSDDTETANIENGVDIDVKEDTTSPSSDDNKPAEWVQWRETSDSTEHDVMETPTSTNCQLEEDVKVQNDGAIDTISSEPSSVNLEISRIHEGLQESCNENPGSNPSATSEQEGKIKDLDGAAVEGMELGSANVAIEGLEVAITDVAVEGMEVASTEGTNETAKTEDKVAVEGEA